MTGPPDPAAPAVDGVADVLAPGVRLLLCGINPGQRTGATGHHFAGRSNRFWPALYASGLTPRLLAPAEQAELPRLGIGITNLVGRTTNRASEVSREELAAGAERLLAVTAAYRPAVVAVLGVTAFRAAFARRDAQLGEQQGLPGPARWWVLPNPSGLNAHARPGDHARGFAEVGRAAGLLAAPHATAVTTSKEGHW